MFKQLGIGKKGFREPLQSQAALDGGMVEMSHLECVEEVEHLVADLTVLEDFVTQ